MRSAHRQYQGPDRDQHTSHIGSSSQEHPSLSNTQPDASAQTVDVGEAYIELGEEHRVRLFPKDSGLFAGQLLNLWLVIDRASAFRY
jgi:hypothetical protein